MGLEEARLKIDRLKRECDIGSSSPFKDIMRAQSEAYGYVLDILDRELGKFDNGKSHGNEPIPYDLTKRDDRLELLGKRVMSPWCEAVVVGFREINGKMYVAFGDGGTATAEGLLAFTFVDTGRTVCKSLDTWHGHPLE